MSQVRMPIYFGPAPGPRQDLSKCLDERKTVRYKIIIPCDNTITHILPCSLKLLRNEICISVFFMYNIKWLKHHGYNMITVTVPVEFLGKEDVIYSNFLLCCWENNADPIITGREELGWCKLYADIYYATSKSHAYITAISENFKFIEISAYNFCDQHSQTNST